MMNALFRIFSGCVQYEKFFFYFNYKSIDNNSDINIFINKKSYTVTKWRSELGLNPEWMRI